MSKICHPTIYKIFQALVAIVFFLVADCALAAMQSDSFEVWLDSMSSGGGNVSSDTFKINSNLSNQLGKDAQSNRLREKVGFSAIENEPTVGFVVQSISTDFGQLSSNFPAYNTHTFSAFTNSKSGYRVKVYGQPLHSVDHSLTPIGQTAQESTPGTEQFGINLVANTVPIVGQNPSGGVGYAAANYDTANHYAYAEGDIIARAADYSFQTDFTVTVLINIAEETPAGAYNTVLTYEFIPIY